MSEQPAIVTRARGLVDTARTRVQEIRTNVKAGRGLGFRSMEPRSVGQQGGVRESMQTTVKTLREKRIRGLPILQRTAPAPTATGRGSPETYLSTGATSTFFPGGPWRPQGAVPVKTYQTPIKTYAVPIKTY